MSTILEGLVALAEDLYQEGYHCGIPPDVEDLWFSAWGAAMRRVAAGEVYTPDLVVECFNEMLAKSKGQCE